MWKFQDKGERECCLIPEVTGIIQELWNNGWDRSMRKPKRFFYISRCYRYDRPQLGRYREFTQFGIEVLGSDQSELAFEVVNLLKQSLDAVGIEYEIKSNVQRGIGYYVEDGFEAECASLGAQKQIAGGGRYKEGIGWAIGIDRVMLAKK